MRHAVVFCGGSQSGRTRYSQCPIFLGSALRKAPHPSASCWRKSSTRPILNTFTYHIIYNFGNITGAYGPASRYFTAAVMHLTRHGSRRTPRRLQTTSRDLQASPSARRGLSTIATETPPVPSWQSMVPRCGERSLL